ncbi:MAG: fumarylacetoacetate hydrolase family protein, partial [Clostridia bacterium]
QNELESLKSRARDHTLQGIPITAVEISAPIPNPRHDILCIGQNYTEHAIESAKFRGIEYQKPTYPVYFSKRVNKAVAHNGFISSHADITSKLDYEAELAVIIGKECSHVAPEDVYDYIFGYTIINDISARDIQVNHKQFTFGKGLDDATPMGPYIVTIDEFDAPPLLSVKSKVNGELRQNSSTNDFIFDIPFMISQLSAGITLYPGDIFITGTPSGVGLGFNPPKWLKSGDIVECQIEKIGILRNTVK